MGTGDNIVRHFLVVLLKYCTVLNMQVYTSVNYHYSEDPEFIQTECAAPEPTQSSGNSPQKVSSFSECFLLLDLFPHFLFVKATWLMWLGEEVS